MNEYGKKTTIKKETFMGFVQCMSSMMNQPLPQKLKTIETECFMELLKHSGIKIHSLRFLSGKMENFMA